MHNVIYNYIILVNNINFKLYNYTYELLLQLWNMRYKNSNNEIDK